MAPPKQTFQFTWDAPDTRWDAGQTFGLVSIPGPALYWDAIGPSTGNLAPYLGLVTSEYNQQPNFMATLAGVFQPLADLLVTYAAMPAAYDIDQAEGEQLDTVGEWVGVTRNVPVPLTGVLFSWATTGLGWGQGDWGTPGSTTVVSLPDSSYRVLLGAAILANQWDGTIPGAYAAWNELFSGLGTTLLITDYQDMSMSFTITGNLPPASILALYTGGYLNTVPAGVRVRGYYVSVSGPTFGWNESTSSVAGWGVGAWS